MQTPSSGPSRPTFSDLPPSSFLDSQLGLASTSAACFGRSINTKATFKKPSSVSAKSGPNNIKRRRFNSPNKMEDVRKEEPFKMRDDPRREPPGFQKNPEASTCAAFIRKLCLSLKLSPFWLNIVNNVVIPFIETLVSKVPSFVLPLLSTLNLNNV